MAVEPCNNGHLDLNLRHRSAVSGLITLGNQAAIFLIQTAGTVVMARLLTPGDFGVVAMVASLVGVATLIKDSGISTAIIQRPYISQTDLSTLFWINSAFGALVAALLACSAPMIAVFYGNPEAEKITLAYAGVTFLGTLGSQHAAILMKDLDFRLLAKRDIFAYLIGVAAGVIASVAGLGYWALVIMQAANVTWGTLFLWLQCTWRPSRPKLTGELKGLLRFGGSVTLSNILTYLNHNVDCVLIGKFLGDYPVGLYSKAQGLLNKPLEQILPPVMRVAYPMFSKLLDDPRRFRHAAIELTEMMCFAGCLLMMLAVTLADTIVLLLLGSQWSESIPLFQILSVFGFLEPISWLMGTMMVASGKPDAMLKWRSVATVIVLAAMIGGMQWGVHGVAAGYALGGIVTRVWLVFFVARVVQIPVWEFVKASSPYFSASATATSFGIGMRWWWDISQPVYALFTFSVLCTMIYLMGTGLSRRGRQFMTRSVSLGMSVLANGPAGTQQK